MILLITGGARSGKSSYAETLIQGPALYIATAQVFDEEMRHRVELHRLRRPSDWQTHEGYRGFADAIAAYPGAVLLDCVTNLLSGILFEYPADWNHPTQQDIDAVEADVAAEVDTLLAAMETRSESLHILVSNELGMGIVPATPLGRLFRDIAGRINQRIAERADHVVLMVSGIPLAVKGRVL